MCIRTLDEMRKFEPLAFAKIFSEKEEKVLTSDVESSIFGIMTDYISENNSYNMADEGGLRNKEELTAAQEEQIENFALLLGMPDDKIYFSKSQETVYAEGGDYVIFGPDALPSKEWSSNPNNNVSLKGTVAHELVGHREAKLLGLTQNNQVLEEVQASLRAAKLAPGLTDAERSVLARDAMFRLVKRDIPLRTVKHKLHLEERWQK